MRPLLLTLLLAACGGSDDVAPPDSGASADAGEGMDAAIGPDASSPDGAASDARTTDAAPPDPDAAVETDAGTASGLYQTCDGNTFYPTGCASEECVEDGLERRVYDIWRARFMAIHGLDAAAMDARIEISDVAVADGPSFVFWRVDYVFVLDWVRSRQNEAVNLGAFPLASPPTDGEITAAVDLAIEAAEQFDLASVAPLEDVLGKFDDCRPDMRIDFCHIDFVNVTGELVVDGIVPIGGGQCANATVDVGSGETTACFNQSCIIM